MSNAQESKGGEVTFDQIAAFSKAYRANPQNKLATNIVTQQNVKNACINRDAFVKVDNVFSNKIKNEAKITNQKSSGRCWMFAALNVIRLGFIKKHMLDNDFEFSQAFFLFWDKFEKANYFLENVLSTLEEDVSGRLFSFLLKTPVQDGGQYDMAVSVVNKYGLVPKSVYPESVVSSCTREVNWLITYRLREFASRLRKSFVEDKASMEALRTQKVEMMSEMYRILCIALGEPPATFDWSFYTKDKEHKSYKDLTALTFVKDHVQYEMNDMISLIHDPRNAYNTLYTVDRLGNVTGGKRVVYVNVPLETLKALTAKVIKQGEAVWFGCDVGKYHLRDLAVMDTNMFDFNGLFGLDLSMSKADRLRYGESLMTHAMTFTGFDAGSEEGEIRKWRVENSWSDKHGDKGYFSMTDDWFNEFVYQVVLARADLPAEVLAVLEQEPVVLPAWDPMGSLAL